MLKPGSPLPDGVEFSQCDIRRDHVRMVFGEEQAKPTGAEVAAEGERSPVGVMLAGG